MRDFYGVILIDVWASRHASVNKFYDDLCQMLNAISFKHIVIPNFGTEPADTRFYQLGRVSTIDCWKDFKNLGYNQGDWILGGQSWGVCTHHRGLGLVPALEYGIESRLFSHPRVMFPVLDNPHEMTDDDFLKDPSIHWQKQTDGFWLASAITT